MAFVDTLKLNLGGMELLFEEEPGAPVTVCVDGEVTKKIDAEDCDRLRLFLQRARAKAGA